MDQLQLIQNAAAKTITGKYKYDHLENDLNDLHWLKIRKRVLFKLALLVYKAINGLAPVYIQELIKYTPHGHSLQLVVPIAKTRYGRRSFGFIGPRLYNRLPDTVTKSENITVFKNSLKTFLFTATETDVIRLLN